MSTEGERTMGNVCRQIATSLAGGGAENRSLPTQLGPLRVGRVGERCVDVVEGGGPTQTVRQEASTTSRTGVSSLGSTGP